MFMISNQDQANGNSRLKHIYNSKEIQQIVADTIDYYETKTEQYMSCKQYTAHIVRIPGRPSSAYI